jgi:catalase-peroxidase
VLGSAREEIQKEFNAAQAGGKKVSLADLIVLGGCAASKQAAQGRRPRCRSALHPGRTDATPGADRCGVLRRARAEGRWLPQLPQKASRRRRPEMLVDRAQLLT